MDGDGAKVESSQTPSSAKKPTFDDMSREDLVKKCKGLLTIAQKAKQAKTEISNELEKLKEQCQKLEMQKTADKESLKTMQEFVDTLTEQKLNSATEAENYRQQNLQLKKMLDERNEEIKNKSSAGDTQIHSLENSLRDAVNKLSESDTTITSLKRQNARYEKDNNTLITQLDELEKKIETLNRLGVEQRKQLLELEKNSQQIQKDDAPGPSFMEVDKLVEELHQCKKDLTVTNEEKLILKQQVKNLDEALQLKVTELNKAEDEIENCRKTLTEKCDNLTESEEKYSTLLKQSETEKVKKEKLNAKLKVYREKLMKCASSITQLKNSKFILLKTVAEYSENVPKWQYDIVNASKLMSEQLLRLENENKILQAQLADTKSSNSIKNNHETFKNQIAQLISKVDALESEKRILVNEKVNAKDNIQKYESENSELQAKCDKYLKEISGAKSEIVELKNTISSLENEKEKFKKDSSKENLTIIESLNNELKTLRTSLVSTEEENKLLTESNENLLRELKKMSESSSECDANVAEHNKVLQADISKLTIKLTAYKTENSCLLHDIKEMKARLIEAERIADDYEEMSAKLTTYKNENVELLNEMKEMNEALKERGEIISKQHTEIAEANNNIKQLEDQLNNVNTDKEQLTNEIKTLNEKLQEKDSRLKTASSYESKKINDELNSEKNDLESQLEQKDSIISALQEDIEKLKIGNAETAHETPDDNLSVSTVSHAEESSRLKDVDSMLEQKYAKLRRLAIKLKKTVGDLNAQVKVLEEDKNKFYEENELLKAQNEQNTNVSENKHKNAEPTNNEHVEKIKKELNDLKKEKQAHDIIIKQYESDLKQMKNISTKEQSVETTELKAKLATSEAQLTQEITKHKQTLEALDKAKRDVKKKSVLSLEMEDYERSMKDLTTKMDENKKKIVQMESTIDTQEGTITSLKTQIKILEDQLKTEENIIRETQELLNNATENLKEKEVVINSKDEEISKLQKEIENVKLKGEETTLQLTSALSEKEKSVIILSQEKTDLLGKLKKTELKYVEVENEMKLKTVELDNIKTEFSGYKIRAQAVLRQNQNKDLDNEENLKEEINALKSEVKTIRTEMSLKESEYESLLNEKNRFASRANELQLLVNALQSEREKTSEQFSAQLQQEILEQKNIKIQMTTLTQCYKKQIADLEEKTSKEITNLKKELEFAHASLARTTNSANIHSQVPSSSDTNNRKELQFVSINNIPDEIAKTDNMIDSVDSSNEINVLMLEREEGEGSESTPSPSPTYLQKSAVRRISRNSREPVPLEQLLEEGVSDENADFYNAADLETKFANAMKQIEMQNKRLAHMTELVAEAEREVMRRSQLAEALKEEVRRYQRSVDRASHHHNQEYLKNVIIKFLTLSSGDERTRLVPVLHTILTLSPDETQQLTAVAKGQDPNANRTWGSFIPWPGNAKN